ncbi:MAG: putative nucleotidyltransferase substrate binding domain-containing protein [Blastocatellia bacterium]|nr:putative nucleotidyltransferase substrate binding domain-containing protein [Blastocatellia bacterium]
MKTSVIRYRVADFLREHQPFDVFSMEDLLAFSGTGRVIFHEDDIHLYIKGQAREAWVWVIQQGRVEILDETPLGAQLRDVLGPGDILGLDRQAATAYSNTARTATEVILYAFDAAILEGLVARYPEAARYLTAHLSAGARHTKALQAPATRERLLSEKEKSVWLNACEAPVARVARRGVSIAPELPVREAARRMREAGREAIAVVDAAGHPLGVITQAALCERIATGAVSIDAPAEAIMDRAFRTAAADRRAPEYLLEMARGRCSVLAITEDGTAGSGLRQVLTDADLAIDCGRNPIALLREIPMTETVAELAWLREQASELVIEGLVGPSVIEWFTQLWAEINRALLERIVALAEADLARAGRLAPELRSCWIFFGSAGRDELLAATAPQIGMAFAEPLDDGVDEAIRYFSTLASKVAAKLQACGLRTRPDAAPVCRTLREWKTFFAQCVQDPIGSRIYEAREYFDFQVVSGDPEIGAELRAAILQEMAGSEAFLPVLANDTIANQPPLTFFQGAVIESDGRLNSTLDVEKTALIPIADAARALAFGVQDLGTPNTLQRLGRAAGAFPLHASILNDAAEAWRIVGYHHALAGFARQGTGEAVQPPRLTRFDQRMLKSAFDSTRRFLELASTLRYEATR